MYGHTLSKFSGIFFNSSSRLSLLFTFFVLWWVFFLWDLDLFGPASRQSELLGELCVIIHLYFNPPMAVLLVPGFLPCLILGRKLIFLPPAPVTHCSFGTGAPDLSGCTVNSINCSGKKSGEEIYSSRLTSTVGSFFCSAHCFVDNCLTLGGEGRVSSESTVEACTAWGPQGSVCGTQKVNPSGDSAETPNSSSISTERIICNYFFDKSWLISCFWRSNLFLMLAN